MTETRNIIKDKTQELLDLYLFEDYKEAEYIACRLVAGQSIDWIKARLLIKIKRTTKSIPIVQNEVAKRQFELGLKRRLNIAKFLEKGILESNNKDTE